MLFLASTCTPNVCNWNRKKKRKVNKINKLNSFTFDPKQGERRCSVRHGRLPEVLFSFEPFCRQRSSCGEEQNCANKGSTIFLVVDAEISGTTIVPFLRSNPHRKGACSQAAVLVAQVSQISCWDPGFILETGLWGLSAQLPSKISNGLFFSQKCLKIHSRY